MSCQRARRGLSESGDPLLFTPGPLTTSRLTKEVMVHDWGSRDAAFLKINRWVLERLPEIAGAKRTHVAVPMQGSGTFAVEAMLTTFVPPSGKVLVLINGAYGYRAKRILDVARRALVVHETPEDQPPDLRAIEGLLKSDGSITHVFAVHCETTSGILNPVAEIGAMTETYGRRLLIDAMSAFGALPLTADRVRFDAVAASSNKCIEGIPGLGFVIAREAALVESEGNATTLSLDLFDQWQGFIKTGQYRFTPPIHVIVAFHQALQEFFAEGGQPARGKRYSDNCRVLIDGMAKLGFKPLLPPGLQAPIIATFHMPAHPMFKFQSFYNRLKDRGYVIYPGKLTVADTFRIGCIGRLFANDMRALLANVGEVLEEMGVAGLEAVG